MFILMLPLFLVFIYPHSQKLTQMLEESLLKTSNHLTLVHWPPLLPEALQKYSMKYLQIYEYVVLLETLCS